MHPYVRIALFGVFDVVTVAALAYAGRVMEDTGYGNISLMYLIAIVAVGLIAAIAYFSFSRKRERWAGLKTFACNALAALCASLYFVGKLYDSNVLLDTFPVLRDLGEHAPLTLLVLAALIALGILVGTRIYADFNERDAKAIRRSPALEASADSSMITVRRKTPADDPSVPPDRGDGSGGSAGRSKESASGAVAQAPADPTDSGGSAGFSRSQLWKVLGVLLLAAVVFTVSIWLCFSPDGFLRLELNVPSVSDESFAEAAVLPIVTVLVVAVSITISAFLLVGMVVVLIRGFARLLGVRREGRSEDPDGSVVALVSVVVFLGVLWALHLSGVNFSVETLLGGGWAQGLVAQVVSMALLLLGSAISVLLIYTILKYAWAHSKSLAPVAEAIAGALVFYIALVFAQVLRYLFFLPDLLSLLLDGAADDPANDSASDSVDDSTDEERS